MRRPKFCAGRYLDSHLSSSSLLIGYLGLITPQLLMLPLSFTSKTPVCHIISGTLARIKEEATGEKYHVKEIKCIAKGDKSCDFVIKPEKYTKIKEKIG